MDANTFPFHNYLPYSESNEGLFLFFSPSLYWIIEKLVETLAILNICDKTQNKLVSSPTVLHKLVLCPAIDPSALYFNLNTHFTSIAFVCAGYWTKSHMLFLLISY